MLPWGTDQTWEMPVEFDAPAGGCSSTAASPTRPARRLYRRRSGGGRRRSSRRSNLDASALCTAELLAPWQALEDPEAPRIRRRGNRRGGGGRARPSSSRGQARAGRTGSAPRRRRARRRRPCPRRRVRAAGVRHRRTAAAERSGRSTAGPDLRLEPASRSRAAAVGTRRPFPTRRRLELVTRVRPGSVHASAAAQRVLERRRTGCPRLPPIAAPRCRRARSCR